MMSRRTVAVSVVLTASLTAAALLAGNAAPAPTPPADLQAVQTRGFVNITRIRVSSVQRDGEWYADVTSAITLNGVPNQSFGYEASLVDRDGKVHTSKRGGEYTASREVSTGDDEDTDRYTVSIPLKGLFSSRPPDLFVRTRLINQEGKVVATGQKLHFSPPGE
jgi:hypothetical protein